MVNKVRKFLCRNGMLLAEATGKWPKADKRNAAGYLGSFIIISGGDGEYYDGSCVRLVRITADSSPIGSLHGVGFDIIEEVTDEM